VLISSLSRAAAALAPRVRRNCKYTEHKGETRGSTLIAILVICRLVGKRLARESKRETQSTIENKKKRAGGRRRPEIDEPVWCAQRPQWTDITWPEPPSRGDASGLVLAENHSASCSPHHWLPRKIASPPQKFHRTHCGYRELRTNPVERFCDLPVKGLKFLGDFVGRSEANSVIVMVLRIRLARFGRRNQPFYNIVVAHARYADISPRE
jgi:Ribosomal protein S16